MVRFTVLGPQPRLNTGRVLPSSSQHPLAQIDTTISLYLCHSASDCLTSTIMASSEPYPSPPASPAKTKADPILRNTFRYTISAKEYKTLHQWFITRSPSAIRRRAPPPVKFASLVQTKDDYNGAAIRASLRVLVLTQTSLKLWESIKTNLLNKGRSQK